MEPASAKSNLNEVIDKLANCTINNDCFVITLDLSLSKEPTKIRTDEQQYAFMNKYFEDAKFTKMETTNIPNKQYVEREAVCGHELINIIHCAFMNHYSLALTPDIFKILLMSGLAMHINTNPEKYRKMFVSHEGKERILVEKQDDWAKVVDGFSEKIKAIIGDDNYNLIVNNFSTTTLHTKIMSETILLDTVSKYFELVTFTRCGIPQIILRGTPVDWTKLQGDFRSLVLLNESYKMGLDTWYNMLTPIMERIFQAGIERTVDVDFWKSLYHFHSDSGTDQMNGWICVFFPYFKSIRNNDLVTNPMFEMNPYYDYVTGKRKRRGDKTKVEDVKLTYDVVMNILSLNRTTFGVIPAGISKVSFVWENRGTTYNMALCSAIVGGSCREREGFPVLEVEYGFVIGYV